MSNVSSIRFISQDILAYLKQHEKKTFAFLTCGNVDDGKSQRLIGRLLYDSKLIYEDQLQAVTRDSKKLVQQEMRLTLLYWLMVYKQNVSRGLPLM